MELLYALAGVVIVVGIEIDVFLATMDQNGGPVSKRLASRVYKISLALLAGRHRLLSWAGIVIFLLNVLMWIGEALAAICLQALPAGDRARVLASLEQDRRVLELSVAQMNAFAGNMLELRSRAGDPLLVMSERARTSLDREQTRLIEQHCQMVAAPIHTIEDSSGGSVRCMLAEIFLPRNEASE